MAINRRNFLKTVGAAGLSLIVSKFSEATPSSGELTEFRGMLYDATRCIGCGVCLKACAKSNQLPYKEEEIKVGVRQNTDENRRAVVNAFDTSKGEVFLRSQCMHCNQPACVAACLTKAMQKSELGPVTWDGDRCMGCRYCMVSCPFDVPKFEYFSSNPVIQKCDMCFDRIQLGKIPACAESCGDALIFGSRRELIAEARKRISESPDDYIDEIYGEHVAGGTGVLYLSPVPFEELGVKTSLQNSSYPSLSKGFLYAVPSVFVLLPTLLLGIHKATQINAKSNEE
jgi:Fe-S-cluster-containing dehydrogenase component